MTDELDLLIADAERHREALQAELDWSNNHLAGLRTLRALRASLLPTAEQLIYITPGEALRRTDLSRTTLYRLCADYLVGEHPDGFAQRLDRSSSKGGPDLHRYRYRILWLKLKALLFAQPHLGRVGTKYL